MRCGGRGRASCFGLPGGCFGELYKGEAPGVRGVQHLAEFFVAFAVTLDCAVLKFDEGSGGAFFGEADVDFAGFGEVGIELPVGAEVPGEGDAMRRLPGEDMAPVAVVAFGVALVPAAAFARLDDDVLEGFLADVMLGGPPGLHLLDEDGKGVFDGNGNAHAFI